MSDESDFVRFDDLPGYQLVDYKRVGLPVYQAQLDVLAEERRELHLVGEYCLRLLQAAVNKFDDLVRLLGVSPHIVRTELADLVRLDAAIERDGSFLITRYGKDILQPYGDTICKEATWYVPFDGILRRPYPWRVDQLRTSRQLADIGSHLEINPIGDRPGARDFETNVVSHVLSQLRFGGKDMDRLVSIRSVRRSPLRFVSAVALAYESKPASSDSARILFLVDGRPTPGHDEAFAASNGLRRPMFRLLGPREDSEIQLRTTTRRRLVRSRGDISPSTRQLAGKLSLANSEEPTPDVRDLSIYSIRSRWAQAFTAATTCLIVTSRSLSASYVRNLLEVLDRSLKSEVRLYFGVSSDVVGSSDDGTSRALTMLEHLQTQRRNVTVQAIDSVSVTHLIIDDRVLLVGDYDWLMPEGARTRQFRHPWVLETEHQTIIQKETDRVLSEFKRTS